MRSALNLATPLDFTSAIPGGPVTLVELGAYSLKFHTTHNGRIDTVKFSYALGHEVYTNRQISTETIGRIVDLVAEHVEAPCLAIATSAVREAENRWQLLEHLRFKSRLAVHVLTAFEETSLLAKAFLAQSWSTPALVLDVGGGSVEIVYLNPSGIVAWESVPLGVIRLLHTERSQGAERMRECIDAELRHASVVVLDHVHATGGAVKAIAAVLGKGTVGPADLEALESRVREQGPPPGLKPARADVFLQGIVLMRKLLDHARASRLTYVNLSIGRQALEECRQHSAARA